VGQCLLLFGLFSFVVFFVVFFWERAGLVVWRQLKVRSSGFASVFLVSLAWTDETSVTTTMAIHSQLTPPEQTMKLLVACGDTMDSMVGWVGGWMEREQNE
jgi:hypothetical protein